MRMFSLIFALALMAGTALAQENTTPQKFNQEPVSTPVDKSMGSAEENLSTTGSQPELRTAMNDEIALRLVEEKNTVAGLTEQLEDAHSSEDRLALQNQIISAKQQGWRDVLAIQLKYAEIGGHTEQAEELRIRVARLDEGLSPQQTVHPTTRDANAQNNKGGK